VSEQPPNGNGRKVWLSRDTFIPWGAAIAFATLAWWGASKYADLERTIQSVAADSASKVAEQGNKLSLEMQALRMTVEYQGRDLAELKKSVDALPRGGGK